VRLCVSLAAIVLIAAVRASAQPAPITVDADLITYDSVQQVVTAEGNVRMVSRRHRVFSDAARYDLKSEVVTATGRVRVLDDQGRELRGRTLVFNTRTEEGVLEPSEGIVDRDRRVYMRAGQIEFSSKRVTASQSFITTCDPNRPFVYVTARRVDVVPYEELVAHDASLYVRGRRLYSTRRFVVSLVPGEEGVLVPGLGSNDIDGYWMDHRARVRVPGANGLLHLKYGTTSGLFGLLTLTHPEPTYSLSLRVGRTQTHDDRLEFDLRPYYVGEIVAETTPQRIGRTPLSWSVLGAAGYFNDQTAGVQTSRVEAQVALRTDPIPLGPRLSLSAGAAFRVSAYGTGHTRTLSSADVTLTHRLDPQTSVFVGYTLRSTGGRSPLLIDDVELQSTFSVGFARAVTDRYRLAASAGHNTLLSETKVTGSAFYALSPSWEVGVSAVYNFRLAAFEDVDYTVRRICDCVDVIVRYRQIRREISLEFGLLGFAERRGPFVPRTPVRTQLPPPGGDRPEGGDQR
jgi:lipopolysaccharide export system protein LptA